VREDKMSVLAIGSQGGKRSQHLHSRAADRLIHTSQMVWERSRNIIRRPQVRDHVRAGAIIWVGLAGSWRRRGPRGAPGPGSRRARSARPRVA
jgi:hypothetical protein